MGIHQPSKAHPQRTIQSAVMSPYIFPTRKGTVPFTSFHFLELFANCAPLSASLRRGFHKTKIKFLSLTINFV